MTNIFISYYHRIGISCDIYASKREKKREKDLMKRKKQTFQINKIGWSRKIVKGRDYCCLFAFFSSLFLLIFLFRYFCRSLLCQFNHKFI